MTGSIQLHYLVAPVGKSPPANAEDTRVVGSNPGLGGSPRGGNGNLLHHSCLENSMNKRSLAGYTPRGHKELDMTENICRDPTGMAESG